jgi:hypothetical protein
MARRPSLPRRRRALAAALLVGLVAGVLVACTPPAPQPEPLPGDIKLMTDTQVEQVLAKMAPDVAAGWADPDVQRDVPPDVRDQVAALVQQLQTQDGRNAYVGDFRAATDDIVRGLPQRPEVVDLGGLGLATNAENVIGNSNVPNGTRVPPPSGTDATAGASVELGPDSSAPCKAPGGAGTIAAPSGAAPGQILTPQHDVFARATSGIAIGQPGNIVIAGVDPVPGQGPGIELRSAGLNAQEVHVRIHLEDPKHFGPAALYPLINIKPIGGTSADEYRATVTSGTIYCYAGDTRTDRGYFDGWVRIPRTEPGFQLIAEVVENDAYFALHYPSSSPAINPHYDAALASSGPQYWAGADRSTVHVGADPLTRVDGLQRSVGAYVSAVPDPGDGTPNALTDTNGSTTDDIEAPIRGLISSTIRQKVNDALSGDLLQWYVLTLQGWLTQPVDTNVDLRFTTPQDGFSVGDEPVGYSGALQMNASLTVHAGLYAQLAGVPCFGMTATVTGSATGNAWADSTGNDTGIEPRLQYDLHTDVNIDMPKLDWLDPTCVLARLTSAAHVGEWQIESQVDDGLSDVLGDKGSVTKMLRNLDLNAYLPTVSLGTATIKPVVTNIDNSWCTATGAPAGCTGDQDLIGKDGVGVVADTTMVSSLGQAIGGSLDGRFRNVFSPTTQSTVSDLTTSHRDGNQQRTALGVVIDPRLINLALRHLVQGSSTSRTTNGLLDVSGATLPVAGWSLSTHPEVAPILLGVPVPPPVNCDGDCTSPYPSPPWRQLAAVSAPDLRVALQIDGGAPIQFSIATSVNAGAGFDPASKQLRPVLDSPQVDFLITGGCKANYTTAYASSYALCGRGRGGNGALGSDGRTQISLTDVISYVVNQVVLPLLTDSIGGISLPSLDGIVPGLHVSLDAVHSQQRGGFLTVYANLRPTPRVEVVPSTEQVDGVTYLRFFPQVYNIDATDPSTTYTWVVTDANTGQVVPTTPYPYAQQTAVWVPVTDFVEVDGNFGKERHAIATLTLDQTALHVSATGDMRWMPPTPPPPSPCAPGGHLIAKATSGGQSSTPSAIGC